MTAWRRITSIVGLLLVAAATLLPVGVFGKLHTGLGKLWGAEVVWWGLAALILAYVVAIERLPLSSIGFRKPRGRDVGLGVAAAVLTFCGMGLIYALVFPALHLKPNTGALAGLYAMPVFYRFLLVTRAAIVEEIIWRGYAIERLKTLTGSGLIAGAVSLAAFTYAHLAGWGAAHLIAVGYAALIITALYLWRRNIWAVMICHFLTDGAAFVILPLIPQH